MSKRAVWKFPMGDWATGMFSAEMPKGAEVLHVQFQEDALCMWVLVDPEAEKEQRHFVIIGTGHESSREGVAPLTKNDYVGTITIGTRASLVFHIFEVFR